MASPLQDFTYGIELFGLSAAHELRSLVTVPEKLSLIRYTAVNMVSYLKYVINSGRVSHGQFYMYSKYHLQQWPTQSLSDGIKEKYHCHMK